MQKPLTWVRTLATQFALCLALYLVLNMGQPQKAFYRSGNGGKPVDIYFVSVRGGIRPLKEQTLLLNLMQKVVNAYGALFVVNISELGEDDPLMQNATGYFNSLKVPWYTTGALEGQKTNYFLKQIKTPDGKMLDIIALDTGLLQDSLSGKENDQINWLTRALGGSFSNWRIVVGFHPLVPCSENMEQSEAKGNFASLCHMFMKYGVDGYLSTKACRNYIPKGSMAHIRSANPMDTAPSFTIINQNFVIQKKIENGFLLHRVSSLEIATYIVTLRGEVRHTSSLQQRGREVM